MDKAEISARGSGAGGRPRSALPSEVIERVGMPPVVSPLKMARWWQHVLAECGWLLIQGRAPAKLVDKVRSLAGTASKIIPADILYAAEKALRADEDGRDEDEGPQTEEVSDGHDGPARSVRSDSP